MTTGVRITQPPGPLAVSSTNPRYFTAAPAPGEAVYLTGSHVNNNLHDGLGMGSDCPEDPERFDFDAYLALLTERGHNFIRLWRWEQFRGQLAPANVHFCMTPQPWPRTGPGSAKDGKPKFDLSAFDQSYFDRIRERVLAAGRAGIYASVMIARTLRRTSATKSVCAVMPIGIEVMRPRVPELLESLGREWAEAGQHGPAARVHRDLGAARPRDHQLPPCHRKHACGPRGETNEPPGKEVGCLK
jgi:hypothetical protein